MKDLYRNKVYVLWEDRRKYTNRLLLAFIISFNMCFTFLFFGPFEISVTNTDSIVFTPREMVAAMTFFSMGICLAFTLILSLLKGKIFNYALTLVFSLTVAGYIQGNFLNNMIGALTGDAIEWNGMAVDTLLNLLLWVLIGLLAFCLLYLSQKIWRKTILFISITLVIMQFVAFISLSFGGAFEITKDRNYILTDSEMFTYSEETNTLVFVLDKLDYDYIEMVLEDEPDFFDKMYGFTSYTNATSEHIRTMPAVNYILTNMPDPFISSREDYIDRSWNQEDKNILEDLAKENYRVNIYTDIETVFNDSFANDFVSNMAKSESTINYKKIIKSLSELSIYRYAPLVLKPFFWTHTDEFNNDILIAREENNVYVLDEVKYSKGLETIELTEDKYFKFYHFIGSHAPYTLLEDGTRSEVPTDVLEQTKGAFTILFKAFEQMKKLGIYDDTAIIITADHGDKVSDYQFLQKETRIGLFYKPRNSEDNPIQYSKAPVSLNNIPATILKSANLPYDKYGRPLDEIGEEEEITRYFYKHLLYDERHKDSKGYKPEDWGLYKYEITGDASDFDNWKFIDKENMAY